MESAEPESLPQASTGLAISLPSSQASDLVVAAAKDSSGLVSIQALPSSRVASAPATAEFRPLHPFGVESSLASGAGASRTTESSAWVQLHSALPAREVFSSSSSSSAADSLHAAPASVGSLQLNSPASHPSHLGSAVIEFPSSVAVAEPSHTTLTESSPSSPSAKTEYLPTTAAGILVSDASKSLILDQGEVLPSGEMGALPPIPTKLLPSGTTKASHIDKMESSLSVSTGSQYLTTATGSPSAATKPIALPTNEPLPLNADKPLTSSMAGFSASAPVNASLLAAPELLQPLETESTVQSDAVEPVNVPAVSDVDGIHAKGDAISVDSHSVLNVEGMGVQSIASTPASVGAADTGTSTVELENGELLQGGNKGEPEFGGGGDALIGCKFRKKFGKKYFFGEIISFDSELNWYKVKYEDEDVEELDWKELESLMFPSRSGVKSLKKVAGFSGRKRFRLSDGHEKKSSPRSANKQKTIAQRFRSSGNVQDGGFSEKDFDAGETAKSGGTQDTTELATGRGLAVFDYDQPSENTDQTLELKESEKESMSVERHRRWRKRKTEELLNLSKRKMSDIYPRGQQVPVEHRIVTRSSTGSLGSHGISPSARSSPRFMKVGEEFRDKARLDNIASRLSPLGGGFKIVGRKTSKDFGGKLYSGEVVGYDPRAKYYKVRYEDGDEEELEWSELKPTLAPQDEQQLAIEGPVQPVVSPKRWPSRRLKDYSRRMRTPKGKQRTLVLYGGRAANGELFSPRRRRRIRTASVSVMMKGLEDWAGPSATPPRMPSRTPPRPLAAARFASASDADIFEYFGWGEVVNYDKAKCPELRAVRLLPTSSPVVHLAASHHHLAAITATGQVWVWRNRHGNIHTRCNEWEHIFTLEEKGIILVDIAGPDLDRTSAGYDAEQEDQVPDPFYLVAVCRNGEDIILQGSQPQEMVCTYQHDDRPRYHGLKDFLLQSLPDSSDEFGRIVQVSVGTVESSDESPFVGYISDTDRVYIRSATRDFMEEINLVAGYTGRPIKIECGSVYHAIIMTDDGRAWTWGCGYYPGLTSTSGFSSKWSFSVCQPAVGTLVGRKVVDVGCYGEDFIALTNDGDVHQWTHGVPNPAAGVYNVPATPIYGQGPCIASVDKLKQVSIGAGMCAGITDSGKVHTWRTAMKAELVGMGGSERETLTPLGRDEACKETTISSLGARVATKAICVAGSLIVVVKRRSKGRRGKKKSVSTVIHKMSQTVAAG